MTNVLNPYAKVVWTSTAAEIRSLLLFEIMASKKMPDSYRLLAD
jgi:hypothetical protein